MLIHVHMRTHALAHAHTHTHAHIHSYDLICLERGHGGYGGNVGDQWDVVNPDTHQLGPDACFASGWYECYLVSINHMLKVHTESMCMVYGCLMVLIT